MCFRRATPRPAGFTLIELLASLAIVGMVLGLLLPAVQAARQAAREASCRNNLRQIGLAFHRYHDSHGVLPPATFYGTTFYSAFVAILPYHEQGSKYAQYDRSLPYDDGRNVAVIGQHVPVYLCPSMIIPRMVPDPLPDCDEVGAPGSYAVCAGTNYAWAGPHDGAVIFARSGEVRFARIRDGLSNTLLCGELNYGLRNYMWGACQWGKVRYGAARWGIGYPGISIATTFGIFNSDHLVSGFAEFQTFRSDHSGGANFLLADGSTHFVNEDIDAQLLDAMATRDGGEVLDGDF